MVRIEQLLMEDAPQVLQLRFSVCWLQALLKCHPICVPPVLVFGLSFGDLCLLSQVQMFLYR
jgi:hypothetical protein